MISAGDYRKHSTGDVRVWGNSLKLKENFFVLNKRQKAIWSYEQYIEKPIYTNAKYERAYEKMVMEKGLEYANEFFKYPEPKMESSPPIREMGDITSFSSSSRRRLLYKLNEADLQLSDNFRFITLTYPKKYPTEGKVYKRDLDVFIKRLKAQFGEVEYIWKLEAQKRGAPHYHCIVFFKDLPNLIFLKKWTSQNWYEVVHRNLPEKDEKHLRAGTNVKLIQNARHLVYYVSKYLSKTDGTELVNQGRFWGASRNWGTFIAKKTLSSDQLIRFRRILKNYLKSVNSRLYKKVSSMPSMTIFINHRATLKALQWCIDN